MPSQIILPDVSLCTIVRDEKMNPAGGIERFIHAHVPHVEEAVIIDTGSVDGTREILEDLSSKYPNLKVLDYVFDTYAKARNYSLDNAGTKYALILDADELLTSERPTNDWKTLLSVIETSNEDPFDVLGFDFKHILPNGKEGFSEHHSKRFLVNSKKSRFYVGAGDFAWENLGFERLEFRDSGVIIKHFIPAHKVRELKRKQWYDAKNPKTAPSSVKGFKKWKAYSPSRDNYL